jgi:hypothetical protein
LIYGGQFVLLSQGAFINLVDLILADIRHAGVMMIPRGFEFVELLLELLIGLDDFVNFLESFFIFGLKVDLTI